MRTTKDHNAVVHDDDDDDVAVADRAAVFYLPFGGHFFCTAPVRTNG